jgi:hypothetical protein
VLVTLSSAIGYGNPRFRHAFEISIVVLAALALVSVADRRRRSRRPEPIEAAAA